MAKKREPISTFRFTSEIRQKLDDLAKRRGLSQTAVLTTLVNDASEGHLDYFLRSACHDAHLTNAMVVMMFREMFRTGTPDAVATVTGSVDGLFGPPPDVPESIKSYKGRDYRAAAIFAAYDQGPNWAPPEDP